MIRPPQVNPAPVALTINDVRIETPVMSGWGPMDYALFFKTEFERVLNPSLFVLTITAGGLLEVKAPLDVTKRITTEGHPAPLAIDSEQNEALNDPVVVVIKEGVAEQTYRLSLDGNAFEYSTGKTDAPKTWQTERIARELHTQIEAKGYAVRRHASVLTITREDNQPIMYDYSDTWNGQAMFAAKGRVATEEMLPPRLDPELVFAVGDSRRGGYYVNYVYRSKDSDEVLALPRDVPGKNPTGTNPLLIGKLNSVVSVDFNPNGGEEAEGWTAYESLGTGVYEETYRRGARTTYMPSTMPHVLVREADGSFTFKEGEWGERMVGDEQSVPAMSFVGKQIHDAFFYRNRLGFITDDSIILSKAGLFFDFWADTAKEVLDSDPIDLTLNSTEISTLRYAVPFNSDLIVFGETSQYTVTAQGALTPRTINAQPTTNFSSSKDVRPLPLGQNLYFSSQRKPWEGVWEYYVMQNAYQTSAQEVTQHVPRYIPQGVHQLAGSPSENMILALTSGEPNALFVYQFLWANDEKVQESWGKWTFSGSVLGAVFIQSRVYLVMYYENEGLFLEMLDLQQENSVLRDRRGHANYADYTMIYEFSPFYLQDREGQNVLSGKERFRTLTIHTSELNDLRVVVGQPHRALIERRFPDTARAPMHQSKTKQGVVQMPLAGDTKQTKIALVNPDIYQTQIQAVEFELMAHRRSRPL